MQDFKFHMIQSYCMLEQNSMPEGGYNTIQQWEEQNLQYLQSIKNDKVHDVQEKTAFIQEKSQSINRNEWKITCNRINRNIKTAVITDFLVLMEAEENISVMRSGSVFFQFFEGVIDKSCAYLRCAHNNFMCMYSLLYNDDN